MQKNKIIKVYNVVKFLERTKFRKSSNIIKCKMNIVLYVCIGSDKTQIIFFTLLYDVKI